MKLIFPVIFFSVLCFRLALAQEGNDNAYIRHKQLIDAMTLQSDHGNEFEIYLENYFLQKELISSVKGHEGYVLHNYYFWGRWFYQNRIYAESNAEFKNYFRYYKANHHRLKSSSDEETLVLRNVIYRLIAFNSLNLNEPADSTIRYLNKAIVVAKGKNACYYASTMNDMGFYFIKQGKTDKGLALCKKALRIVAGQNPTTDLLAAIRNNIASVYLNAADYKKALLYYEANFELFKRPDPRHARPAYIDAERLLDAGARTVTTSLKLGQKEKAEDVVGQIRQLLQQHAIDVSAWPQSRIEFLLAEKTFFEQGHQYREALQKVKLADMLKDSLMAVKKDFDNRFAARRAEYQLGQSQQLNAIRKRAQGEKITALRYQRLLLAFLGTALVVLIALLIRRFNKLKIRSEAMRRQLAALSMALGERNGPADDRSRLKMLEEEFEKHHLSKREIQIMACLTVNKTNQEIAEELCISPNTVKFHLKNIYQKLSVSGRQELLAKVEQ